MATSEKPPTAGESVPGIEDTEPELMLSRPSGPTAGTPPLDDASGMPMVVEVPPTTAPVVVAEVQVPAPPVSEVDEVGATTIGVAVACEGAAVATPTAAPVGAPAAEVGATPAVVVVVVVVVAAEVVVEVLVLAPTASRPAPGAMPIPVYILENCHSAPSVRRLRPSVVCGLVSMRLP